MYEGGTKMEEIMECIQKRSKLLYDINCIKHYIEGGDYDKSLKEAWHKYNNELVEVNNRIAEYVKPHYSEIYEQKNKLAGQIKEHKNEIKKLKEQIEYLDSLMMESEA